MLGFVFVFEGSYVVFVVFGVLKLGFLGVGLNVVCVEGVYVFYFGVFVILLR